MKVVLTVLLILAFVTPANAQTRCECEYDDWVDDCDAEFERKGDWILFKSDTEQCSRIDWHADSQPRLTIVEDGKKTVNLMGISDDAEISIASCKVCKDRQYRESPNSSTSTLPKAPAETPTVIGVWCVKDRKDPNGEDVFLVQESFGRILNWSNGSHYPIDFDSYSCNASATMCSASRSTKLPFGDQKTITEEYSFRREGTGIRITGNGESVLAYDCERK